MIILFIAGLILGAITIVFDLQNSALVTVYFFNWQWESSMSVMLTLTFFAGIAMTCLMLLPETISSYFQYRRLKKENIALAEELRKQKELTHFAKKVSATQEELRSLDEGVIAERGV